MPGPARLTVCQMDGLVLLKMIKHCYEHVPEEVTGLLLGLEVEGRLEVTSCFPQVSGADEEDDDDYQLAMMQMLKKVNVDNNTVGWYQSAFRQLPLDAAMVETQYSYQKHIPNSVCVVYDPVRTTDGYLALNAYRLTDNFMKLNNENKFSHKAFAQYDMDSRDIFEEIPIKVHNSHLVHAFLYELREEKAMSCDADRLNLYSSPFLEKNLELMSSCVDDYTQDQSKFQYHQRQLARQAQQQQALLSNREEENKQRIAMGKTPLTKEEVMKDPIFKPIPEPSRLEAFLISNQLDQYCQQIINQSNSSFNKLYLIEAMRANGDAKRPASADAGDGAEETVV